VIPTYNRPEMLSRCLDHVLASINALPGGHAEVIVTDNSTNIESERLVRDCYPTVKWVKGPGDGPAKNRNNGVKCATGHWLAFVDDDCLPSNDWLKSFLTSITVAGDAKVFEGSTVGDREQRSFDEEAPINRTGGHLWGCNFVIWRELYLRLGGFHESFPYGYEDIDLLLRLRRSGETVLFVPEAVVCHPFRPVRGLGFHLKSTNSYLLLVQRNPEILGNARWESIFFNFFRRLKQMCLPALKYRFRGLWYILGVIALQAYAEVRATSAHRMRAGKLD
jgi:GT2 family glycosyltransferase